MSALSAIKSLFWPNPSQALAVKQAPITTEFFGPLGQRAADWSHVSTNAKVRDAFTKCATAYACATLLADALAESPMRVYRVVDGELEEDPTHRARALFANPNPALSEAEFLSMTGLTMCLWGYAVTEIVRSGAGLPVELWPLRPDWLKRERTNTGSRWVYRRTGLDPREIADEDIEITPFRHDPSQTSFGIGPLQIVAREVGIDVALTDLLKVFIDAGGIPPWVIKLSGDMEPFTDQAQADAFRLKWAQTYGGSQAYGKIGVLNPGMDLVKVGDSVGEMAWPDLRGLTELKIAQAFRVPADLIQAKDTLGGSSLTTSEMDGAMSFLQRYAVQPLRMRLDGSFTQSVLHAYTGGDPTIMLEFDTSAILALQEDTDARHTRIRADYDAGLISLNEARRETNRPDLGRDGEVYKLSFTTILTPIGAATETSTNGRATIRGMEGPELGLPFQRADFPLALANGKTERVYRDIKALSPAELETRASILQTTQRERQRLTEIGARALRTFFREQGRRIVGQMPKAMQTERDGTLGFKVTSINWDDEDELLKEVLTRFYNANGSAAFTNLAASLGVEISWDLANPNIARIMDELGLRIVGISEQTRLDVIERIAAGQSEGMTLQQIADSITDLFENDYKNRSMLISRTESMVSYGKASILGYEESGVVDQVEIHDNPDHTEPYEGAQDGLTCAERHMLVVPLDRADFHLMSDHPNGSATLIPILSTPLGEV